MFGIFKKKQGDIVNQPVKQRFCPHCQILIEKEPIRKFKCSGCGNQVLVRKHYKTDSYELFTEDTVKKYDREKDAYYRAKSLIRGLKMSVQDDKKIDKLVQDTQLAMNQKFGFEAALGDVAWSVSNQLIHKSISNGDNMLLHSVYFQMGIFLHDSGKDHRDIMALASQMLLRENYKDTDIVKEVEVLATDDSCEACKSLNGKKFLISEAVEKKILPCRECSYGIDGDKIKFGWCRCCYLPVI